MRLVGIERFEQGLPLPIVGAEPAEDLEEPVQLALQRVDMLLVGPHRSPLPAPPLPRLPVGVIFARLTAVKCHCTPSSRTEQARGGRMATDVFPVATTPAPGLHGVDWENRVDFDRLLEGTAYQMPFGSAEQRLG